MPTVNLYTPKKTPAYYLNAYNGNALWRCGEVSDQNEPQ